MLKHKNCGTQIYLDYTSNLKLVSRPILSSNGLVPSFVEIIGQMSNFIFFCPECGKVELNSLVETCNCGKSDDLENLWLDRSESGIIWCNNCLEDEKRRNPMVRTYNLKMLVGNYRR